MEHIIQTLWGGRKSFAQGMDIRPAPIINVGVL
jgi:hypothetical protein